MLLVPVLFVSMLFEDAVRRIPLDELLVPVLFVRVLLFEDDR